MPQLDGLRAVAVLSVMVAHFAFPWWIKGLFRWGGFGVQLFFVLSGFLITGILLRCRQKTEAFGVSRAGVLRQFYIRRVLRIFPIYYLTLFVFWHVGVAAVKEPMVWHLTYLTNVYITLKGHFWPPAGHFWSLAVEEQFYLIWPCAVLFLPRRALPWTILASMGVAPLFALAVGAAGYKMSGVLMPSCMTALGGGALLAWVWLFQEEAGPWRKRYPRCCLLAGLPLFLGLMVAMKLDVLPYTMWTGTLEGFVMVIFLIWVVDRGATGFSGLLGAALESGILRYIGKISYGVYVYHNFTRVFAPNLVARLNIPRSWWPVEVVICILLTLGVASASWHLLESPLNNLKRFFPYVRSTAPGTPKTDEPA